MRPEWIFVWPILALIGYIYMWFDNPTEYTEVWGLGFHVGIPLVIYFFLKQRQKKKAIA